jgi:formate-dependent nitrite reductase membrane component NrfD
MIPKDKHLDPKEPPAHGRFIDSQIATLEGEASGQHTKKTIALSVEPSMRLPTEYPAAAEGPTYYGQPVLQTPVWIWAVPAYFYVGGTAGGALALAAAAQLADGSVLRALIHRCRWIGAAGIALGSGLLIYDLGRPARFLNMLRVFRPTSPLNVGSWLLAAGGGLATGAAVLGAGPFRRLADLLGYAAGAIGLPLAGYTGVVLANTAVPVWQESRRALPGLFIASGIAGTASLLELMDLGERERRVAKYFGVVGKVGELSGMLAAEREAASVPHVARPYRRGFAGTLWNLARGLIAAGLITSVLPGHSRKKRLASGLLGSAGALCLRFATFEAGIASAADPRATFRLQRATQQALTRPEPARAVPPAPERTMTGRPS